MPSIPIHGVALHYEDSGGANAPIVFSHGLLWSNEMFAAQVTALRDRFRCIAYDHRGQGRSESSPMAYDMEHLTDDAAVLIERLGAAPCHFVGLSMGGFVGLRLAIRRPELLRSLTLIDSAADAEPRHNIPKYKAMSLFSRFFGYGPLLPAVTKIMFSQSFLRDVSRTTERREYEQRLLSLVPARVELALNAVIYRKPVLDQLGEIRTPTLIIHGRDDKAIVPARARRTLSGIAGARYQEIPNAGHSSTMEEPAAVSAALGSFLNAIAQADPP